MTATMQLHSRPTAAPVATVSALVIDPDDAARAAVRGALQRDGMKVAEARSGREGQREAYRLRPGLIVLGLVPRDPAGWRLLEHVCDITDTPVLVVSDSTSELDAVRALRTGADDHLTKPVGRLELVARARAVLRRTGDSQAWAEAFGDELIEIDLRSAAARVAGRPLTLTPLEFRLLCAFVRHPGHVLSSDQLLRLAWRDNGFSKTRVKLYVSYLRARFRESGVEPPIETIRGFGYRYQPARPRLEHA